MTRTTFYDTSFTNSNFLKVYLGASDFDSCKLKITRFFKSNFILVEDVKVWKSKEWVEIKDFSTFENHFDQSIVRLSNKNPLRDLKRLYKTHESFNF